MVTSSVVMPQGRVGSWLDADILNTSEMTNGGLGFPEPPSVHSSFRLTRYQSVADRWPSLSPALAR